MKAIIIQQYGTAQELMLSEYEQPSMSTDQVLIRIKAFGINPLDWMIRSGRLAGFTGDRFPKILGGDFAGIVEAVGANVTDVAVGEAVFGMANTFFGQPGSYAEYVSVAADQLAPKPDNMTFVEAASVPLSALTALQGLRQCVETGQQVLVHGASGGVGLFGVQIARQLGGTVTAVCGPNGQDWVKALGANRVLNYTQADWMTTVGRFDTVFDVVGKLPFNVAIPLLESDASFLTTQATPDNFALVKQLHTTDHKMIICEVSPVREDLTQLRHWIEEGKITTKIDGLYSMPTIGSAHERSESGRVKGKLVVQVDQ